MLQAGATVAIAKLFGAANKFPKFVHPSSW